MIIFFKISSMFSKSYYVFLNLILKPHLCKLLIFQISIYGKKYSIGVYESHFYYYFLYISPIISYFKSDFILRLKSYISSLYSPLAK
jgi:hypothetical protein